MQRGDIVMIEYPNQGNGPWNYCEGGPPPGVTHWRSVGIWMGEDERHYLTAHDLAVHDGTLRAVFHQHWSKDGAVKFTVMGRVEL